MRFRELRIYDHRDVHGEIRQRQPILALEVDAEGMVVDHLELLGFLHRPSAHLDRGKTANLRCAVERPFDVRRRYRSSVVKNGVLA
jgi:hypothetical protein